MNLKSALIRPRPSYSTKIPPSSPIFSREPTLGRDGDSDWVRDDDLDWIHVQGRSLSVAETEYVPAISHLSTCFVLTYVEVP
jgi:hypothetical protein